MNRKFNTALRPYVQRRLEEIGQAEIVVGIPCYNNEETIAHVLRTVSRGLSEHFGERRALIMVSDGGSTDDTRQVATDCMLQPWQEKIVCIYRGPGGKGSALRGIFEAADRLGVSACAVVDSDLRSIVPDWVGYLLDPVMSGDYDYVAPVYSRYKYDGTITNNIVYNLTRALYGKRIRQPIGGDFAFSRNLARHWLEQDVWHTDIARFGIDIWMTTQAIVEGARICQANLGTKVHDAKDPGEALGPMFRQVIGTVFNLMEEHQDDWLDVRGSEPVPVSGMDGAPEPDPIEVDQPRMVRAFQEGFTQFGPLWRDVFSEGSFETLEQIAGLPPEEFAFEIDAWADMLYEVAAHYHRMRMHRFKFVSMMTPLYLGRVAGFITQTRDMSNAEAEEIVEEQARAFEERKDYLVELWNGDRDASGFEDALASHR